MKKLYLITLCLLVVNVVLSQTPQGFSYQAVLRDGDGQALINKSVIVRLSFLSGSSTGSPLYVEDHDVSTNGFGLINIVAGEGVQRSGAFGDINWSEGNIWLKVEVDKNPTSSFTEMGCTKLLSVPYALYAAAGNQGEQGLPGENGNGISGVVDNGDGTITFNFTDGSYYKTPNLKGEKGDKGDAGTGLNNKGAWTANTTYNPSDYVFATNSAQTGNAMWIVQASAAFVSTVEPRLDLINWVEFQAPKGEAGETGENGISIEWLGTRTTPPIAPTLNQAYYNAIDKVSYIWNGSWSILAQDGAQGPAGSLVSGTLGQTLYHDGTTWIASSSLVNDGTNVGIGVTPVTKLDINGGVRLRSALYDNTFASLNPGASNQILTSTGSGVLWQSPSSLGVASGTGTLGQLALWSGANSLQGTSNLTWGTTSLQIASPVTAGTDDPILEVKNKDGNVVFGVYQGGVRIYVEDAKNKGARGGFAVGGLSGLSKESIEYFRITPDSARIYVNETTSAKGARGGFAVGGLSGQSKAVTSRNMMFVAPDSTRFWVNETVSKGARGGFAVGGLSGQSKGTASNFMQLTPENYFIGHLSGSATTTGLYNNFLGYQTGLSNTTGSSNAFIGYKAGYSNANGSSNVFIGNESGYTNSTGEYNTFLGYKAGYTNNANYNTFIGYQAGRANTSGQYNSFMGYNSGSGNTTGYKNVFLGYQSGALNTTGASNVYIGTSSGYLNNGTANVAIGDSAISHLTSGSYNIVIGRKAGLSMTSGSWNVLIGESAGYSSPGFLYNVMIGQNAGYNSMSSFNTFMGINAGYKIQYGTNNVFLGTNAGAMLESGSGNTIIGIDAGRSGDWDPGVYHGFSTSNNTLIGTGAGYNFDSGDRNTLMGCLSGNGLITGSGNVFIGYKAGSGIDGVSDQLYIANDYGTPLIYGNFLTKLIGLGTTSPLSNLHIEATALNQYGHLLVNRSVTGGLGGTIVIRNRTSSYPGNAAALSFELDGSTAFETNGSNAGNAEIRSTIVDFNGATDLRISNWNGTSHNSGIVLASSGDVTLGNSLNVSGDVNAGNSLNVPFLNVTSYANITGDVVASGTVETSYLYVDEDATVAGTLNGNVAGNLQGKVNGFYMDKLFVQTSGTILTSYNGSFTLIWDSSTGLVTLSNSSAIYCVYWYQSQLGTSTAGNSNRFKSGSITIPVEDTQGVELNFGDIDGASTCTVWLQRTKGDLVGHYTKYE